MILSDKQICRLARDEGFINPFFTSQIRETAGRRIISAGCSSYGYDMRLAPDGFQIFKPWHHTEVDPKNFNPEALGNLKLHIAADGSEYYLLPPHAYALGVSLETFKMPRNITGLCTSKSTYARSGLLVHTTILEAGWMGRLVIELANMTNLSLRVYVHEGIVQVVFFQGDEDCAVSYADRGGKYQNQTGLTYARL